MEKKVLIADDHNLIRNGLKLIFQTQLGIADIGQVSSCHDLMEELKTRKYTHVILDINLSDGSVLEILGVIHRLYPDLRMAIITQQPKALYERVVKKYGICVYLSKSAPEKETIWQLREFMEKEMTIKAGPDVAADKNRIAFTPREAEVLNYMLQGMRTNDIAIALNLKGNTISTVKNRIFEKTKTSNLIQLQEYAALHKIL